MMIRLHTILIRVMTTVIMVGSLTAGAMAADTFPPEMTASGPDRVFVINEGAFGTNNASVTVFHPGSGDAEQGVFDSANDRLLGDIGNDARLINGLLYIVVNNSHKIEVIDPETYISDHTIYIDDEAHGGSPRRILQVSGSKAYVSNMLGNNLSVIDLDDGEEIGTVDLGTGSSPEAIVMSGDYAFVALSGMGSGNEVAVIDVATDELVTRIEVGDNPINMAVSPDGLVWSVATGNYGSSPDGDWNPEEYETFGEVVIIDPDALEVVDRFETGGHPGRLAFFDDETALLQLGGLRVIDIENRELVDEPWLERSMHSFNIETGQADPMVYVTVAPDFASAGQVVRYDAFAVAVDSFKAGVGPGPITFYYRNATDAEQEADQPVTFHLDQNYPNPFNPTTNIRFRLEQGAIVRLEVYDLQGRLMATPVAGQYGRGVHTVTLDATDWASGVYIYRLHSSNEVQQRKMMLIQ